MTDGRDPMSHTDDEEERTLPRKVQVHSVLRRRRPHVLQLVKGPGAPRDFVLSADELMVGRSTSSEICIASEDLSRRHMRLRRIGDEYTAEDLDSRNGVLLNGVRVRSATLREGDTLQLGTLVFVYVEGA